MIAEQPGLPLVVLLFALRSDVPPYRCFWIGTAGTVVGLPD